MSEGNERRDASSSISALRRIEAVCQRFEAAWKKGDQPRIEEFLGDAIDLSERGELLRELLLLDLDYKRRSGDDPDEDAYRASLPQDGQLISEVFEALVSGAPRAETSPYCVRIRCPHCQNPIELVNEEPLAEITCPSCNSHFSLAGDTADTLAWPAEETMVGHFQLVRRLGVGTFGEVWQANDLQLNRSVAVKLPRKANLSSRESKQFLREAQAAANLNHPGIVSVHEVGQQGGRIYIVSDLVQGIDLAKRLESGPFNSREAAELCIKIAEALHYAHEQGVIHRDLKPANIMIEVKSQGSTDKSQTDSSSPALDSDLSTLDSLEPHVMDFGLAKREAGEITMTLKGQLLGTPAYMSPEQAKGDAHNADRRSDVYSLGVILFELLTGEHPFRGNQQMLLYQIINDDAPSPRKLNSNVPRDLETICLKCLEKDPARRYATAGDLAAELRRFQNDQPIRARPISRVNRLWRWCSRNRRTASLISLSACLLVTVAVVSTLGYFRERDALVRERDARVREQELSDDLRKQKETERQLRKEAQSTFYADRVKLADLNIRRNLLKRAEQILKSCPRELRGWEWNHLWRQCHHGETIEIPGEMDITDIAINDDGTVFYVKAGSSLFAYTRQKKLIWRVECDGHRIAYSPQSHRIGAGKLILDARTGERIAEFKGTVLAISSDGKRVAWMRRNEGMQQQIDDREDERALAFLVSTRTNGQYSDPVVLGDGGTGYWDSASFSATGEYLAFVKDSALAVWSVNSNRQIYYYAGPRDHRDIFSAVLDWSFASAHFHPRKPFLVVTRASNFAITLPDSDVEVFRITQNSLSRVAKFEGDDFNSARHTVDLAPCVGTLACAFDTNGRSLFLACANQTIKEVELDVELNEADIPAIGNLAIRRIGAVGLASPPITSIAVSGDGRHLAVALGRQLRFWPARSTPSIQFQAPFEDMLAWFYLIESHCPNGLMSAVPLPRLNETQPELFMSAVHLEHFSWKRRGVSGPVPAARTPPPFPQSRWMKVKELLKDQSRRTNDRCA